MKKIMKARKTTREKGKREPINNGYEQEFRSKIPTDVATPRKPRSISKSATATTTELD